VEHRVHKLVVHDHGHTNSQNTAFLWRLIADIRIKLAKAREIPFYVNYLVA